MPKWPRTVREIAKKIIPAAAPAAPPRRSGDPWLRDDDRKRVVNDASPRNARRWLPRRAGWLSRAGWFR